jgi:hypothetical protein
MWENPKGVAAIHEAEQSVVKRLAGVGGFDAVNAQKEESQGRSRKRRNRIRMAVMGSTRRFDGPSFRPIHTEGEVLRRGVSAWRFAAVQGVTNARQPGVFGEGGGGNLNSILKQILIRSHSRRASAKSLLRCASAER